MGKSAAFVCVATLSWLRAPTVVLLFLFGFFSSHSPPHPPPARLYPPPPVMGSPLLHLRLSFDEGDLLLFVAERCSCHRFPELGLFRAWGRGGVRAELPIFGAAAADAAAGRRRNSQWDRSPSSAHLLCAETRTLIWEWGLTRRAQSSLLSPIVASWRRTSHLPPPATRVSHPPSSCMRAVPSVPSVRTVPGSSKRWT